MRVHTAIALIILTTSMALAQTLVPSTARLAGGRCEGCEAVFEFGNRALSPIDTLPDFASTEPKLKITGTIYMPDGVTPAEGVILYVYHTDRRGIYAKKGDETGWARRHGYIRGWMKTGKDGRYTFYTFRPASYPSTRVSQHIHPTILEPNGRYYYIDEYLFDDDPHLSEQERATDRPRGGTSGILTLTQDGDLLVGTRDVILGRNIPGY